MYDDATIWSHIREIPGWLTEQETYAITALARNASSYAELGLFAGRSFLAAALSIKDNGRIFGVDRALLHSLSVDQVEVLTTQYQSQCDMSLSLDSTIDVVRRLRPDVSVQLYEMETTDAAAVLPDVDLLFIDASHEYDAVKRDIELYVSKTKVLAGHDFTRVFPGVVAAVDELIPDREIVNGTTIWIHDEAISGQKPGFDEAAYLAMNIDVAEAVRCGHFASGADHYAKFGANENRAACLHTIETAEPQTGFADSAVPPPHLRSRVHGTSEINTFASIGQSIAQTMVERMESVGLDRDTPLRLLDFGCGCGRITRWLSPLLSRSEIDGTDIDADAIQWCCQNLSKTGRFSVSDYWPPSQYEDATFDVILATSVFTHLPHEMQFAWLDELRRITRPGGFLLLTVLGPEVFEATYPHLNGQLLAEGFRYIEGDGTDGLPEFYQSAYHTESYIRSQWSRYVEVQEVLSKEIGNYQDLVICRRQ